MSHANRAVLLASASLLLWGCSGDPTEGAKAGRERWLATKATCGTYHYSVEHESFGGPERVTSIEITGDTPSARMFFKGHPPQNFGEPFVIDETWTEVGAEVGSHSGVTGAALPRTMDQLYEGCLRDVVIRDPKENLINFQADDRGVLEACIYFPRGCADDCGVGVIVSDFACGPLDLTPIRP